MKKIFLLIAAPFAFFSAISAQISQEAAGGIVLERLNQETLPYIVCAKEGLQTDMTISTMNGEEFKLDYPCWVYYVSYPSVNCCRGHYLIINESNGNLLEVNAKSNAAPKDLAEWRVINKQLKIDEIIEIKWGDTVINTQYGLSLRVENIEDCRCPIGVECDWEGYASATLHLVTEKGQYDFTLDTHLPPIIKSDTVIEDIRYRLIDILPYPVFGEEPPVKTVRMLVGSQSIEDFSFHRNGSWSGLNETLKITVDSTHYSVSYRNLQTSELISYQTAIKTAAEQWNDLTKSFDFATFANIQDGPCRACVDGLDETFSVIHNGETYSCYNGNGDDHFKQMQEFFDAMLIQASIFKMNLAPSSGCSSFNVYKLGNNDYNALSIAVTGNREKLNLSKTEQTFDLSKTAVQDLNVKINKFTGGSHGYYCDYVFEGELLDTWTSVSGTVKIKIVQDYEGNPEDFEKIYTINVVVENAVLKNGKGNTMVVDRMQFNNVTVGWLPG